MNMASIFKIASVLIFGVQLSVFGYKSPEYVKYASDVTRKFIRAAQKEYPIRCDGTGGGMPYDIEELSVSFWCHKNLTLEEVRKLHVQCTEKFREFVNEDKKIRQYLREYPFPSSRVRVMISFPGSKEDIREGTIVLVFQARGDIVYNVRDKETKKLVTLSSEPYEEARKIVLGSE